MKKRLLDHRFVLMLAVWMAVVGAVPSNGFAFPSQSLSVSQPASLRDAQIDRIMDVLSRPEARLHLSMTGASPREVRDMLTKLDDAQLTQVADQAEAIKAGGDGLGLVIGLLVIVLLVVLIINLTNKRIEIKDAKK